MLVELTVENFAVVEKQRVVFHAGLNVLTGETGSGKSLVVDALGLLLGGRASAEMVRTGSPRAFVSGVFALPEAPALRRLLEEAGLETEDGEIILEREIQAEGKSRAFAGGRPVTASFLKDLAPHLGDIHGQHDQQRLFDPASQRDILDEAAGHAALCEKTAARYSAWSAAVAALRDLDRAEQERARLADLWQMQRKEIEALDLKPDEEGDLENERRVLKNVSRLQDAASAAYEALSESDSAATVQLASALKRLEELGRIDETLSPLAATLKPAQIAVDEVAHELRHYLGHLEADPSRLETVESRLAGIERLKRKYGSTVNEILAFLEDVRTKLAAASSAGERRQEMQAGIERLDKEFRAAALELRASRQKAARRLEKQVETEMAALAMPGSVFKISFEETPPSPNGLDEIHFLVSTNKGEEPKALEKVASGGELSRIALSLKTCITARATSSQRTLVFDEVDAGVSGSAAETVGRRLKQLAASSQVLCVTHLAQIAGFANHHFVVAKRESNGRTISEVRAVEGEERVREIGRLVSGQKLSTEALRHAEKLLADYARAK